MQITTVTVCNARRREIIGMYDKALESLPVSVLNHFDKDHKSSGHLYLIRVQGKMREECNEIIPMISRRRANNAS